MLQKRAYEEKVIRLEDYQNVMIAGTILTCASCTASKLQNGGIHPHWTV